MAVGRNASLISRAVAEILRGSGKKGRLPKFWDGVSANRVADHLNTWFKTQFAPGPISPGKVDL
jgi:hypothetical protein